MKEALNKKTVYCLEEESVPFDKKTLGYRLEYLPTEKEKFRVTVTLGEEKAEAVLADRPEEAFRRFRLLTDGCVTPCTLGEIIEDWNYDAACPSLT